MLPQLKLYETPDDIKYVLFEQSDIISDEIRKNGNWNIAGLELCDKILSNSDSGRVLDIGAGFGTFSIPLAIKHGQKFIFSAFEPLTVINQQLNANILLNSLDNIRAYPFGISDKNELIDAPILDVHYSNNHGSYSFDAKVNAFREIPNFDNNEVYEFRTLDSFRFANVKLIKISTPGMELKVLQSASKTLENNNSPPVLFESWTNDWYKEERIKVMDFFASRAYEHYVILGEHVVAFKTKAQHDIILNSIPTTKIASFSVSEQSHDLTHVLNSQGAL